MKLRHFLLSLTAMAASVAPARAAELSLDDCLRIALSESPTVKVAEMDITRVDYLKKNNLAELLPQISCGAQYSRMLAKQVAYMNMSGFGSLGGSTSGGENEGDSGESRF